MDRLGHFANAFTQEPGRCFRLVQLPGVGHPTHCPGPVVVSGRWRAGDRQLRWVEACEGHAWELSAPLSPSRSRLF